MARNKNHNLFKRGDVWYFRMRKKGKWIKGPGDDFFKVLFKHFPSKPFIAEDLGHITADVVEAIEKFQLPCTRVLLFGFDDNRTTNPHCPYNHIKKVYIYTCINIRKAVQNKNIY